MPKPKSLKVGDVVAQGNLEVLETKTVQEKDTKRGYSKVRCKFCGSETWKRNNILKRKRTFSCGCRKQDSSTWIRKGALNIHWRLPPGEASFNNLLYQYKHSAERRGHLFELDEEFFRKITQQNCYYCKSEPNQIKKGQGKTSGDYVYNGIDRIDSTKGYTPTNVVPCCFICNNMKGKMNEKDFYRHIEKILKNKMEK